MPVARHRGKSRNRMLLNEIVNFTALLIGSADVPAAKAGIPSTGPGAGNLSPVMTDDEEAIQNTKGERWDGKKVHCSNRLTMIPEERQPSLRRIWISRGSSNPSRDTPFREIETQLDQLAVNARRSPGRILGRHTEDQGAHLFADMFTPSRSSGS